MNIEGRRSGASPRGWRRSHGAARMRRAFSPRNLSIRLTWAFGPGWYAARRWRSCPARTISQARRAKLWGAHPARRPRDTFTCPAIASQLDPATEPVTPLIRVPFGLACISHQFSWRDAARRALARRAKIISWNCMSTYCSRKIRAERRQCGPQQVAAENW